jgi:hypothetical protein
MTKKMNLKKLKFLGVNIYAATFIGLLFLFFSEKIQNQVNPTYSVEISTNNVSIKFDPVTSKAIDDLQSEVDEITSYCGSEDKVKITNSRLDPNAILLHLTFRKNYNFSDCLNYIDQSINYYYNEEVNSDLSRQLNHLKEITYEDLRTYSGSEEYHQTLINIKELGNHKNRKISFSITEFEQKYPDRLLFNYLSFFVGFLLLFFYRALKSAGH